MSLFYDKDNSWYHDNVDKYEKLKKLVDEILNSLTYEWENKYGLHIHDVKTRLKVRMSFLDKVKKKRAIESEDIEDLFGARIICFTLTDVETICDLLKSRFLILEKDDKSKRVENTIGYRAIHLRARLSLKEHPEIEDLVFEIQVRTVFQDAWAVISHEKKYKYGGHIPLKLTNTLESFSDIIKNLDQQFDSFVKETNEINESVPEHIRKIEEDYPHILEYIYTGKAYGDLNFSYRENKIDLNMLQQEIFGSITDIRSEITKDSKLKGLLGNILDSNYELYYVARNKINFNENANPKIINYVKKHLRATFRQNGQIVLEPNLISFATSWRGVYFKTKLDDELIPKKLVINKNEDLVIDKRLDIFDIWLDTVRLRHIDSSESCRIKSDSYSISLKDIPSGVYVINIKASYEPSNDSTVRFEDLICID